MGTPYIPEHRPCISLSCENKILHDCKPCRVVLRKHKISVGCSDITPQALKFLLDEYNKSFKPEEREVVIE